MSPGALPDSGPPVAESLWFESDLDFAFDLDRALPSSHATRKPVFPAPATVAVEVAEAEAIAMARKRRETAATRLATRAAAHGQQWRRTGHRRLREALRG